MIDFTKELSLEDIDDLKEKYPEVEDLVFPNTFRHSLDQICSRILYVLLREYQPQTCVEFGTYQGGSGRVIVQALNKNGKPFTYTGFEVIEVDKKIAEENIIPLAPDKVKIYGDITKELDKVPTEIDFAFIDPNWDREIAEWWVENLLPRIKLGGLVQIHDWSVQDIDGKLVYEGGNFPGVQYLIELVGKKTLPLKKIFAVWDHQHYKAKWIAASFWIKI